MSSSPESDRLRTAPAPVLPLPARPIIAPPSSLTSFVGREHDIAIGSARLEADDVRVLTLTGPGGSGKTRLALEIAANLASAVVESVAWVPLAALRDPAAVMAAIARALGVGEVHILSLVDATHAAIRQRRILILLDNCEHLLGMVPQLASLLTACPTLRVLATSREPLRISGEWIQEVPPLSLPTPHRTMSLAQAEDSDAVRLFVRRAEAMSDSFSLNDTSAPLVARICHQLEGMPLAIELAAARLNQLPLSAIAERLGQRLPLLAGGPRDAPARHQTMRNAIAWSHDLLSEREKRLFHTLAVFEGGFTLEAVDAVAGEKSFDVVMALVDKSVVRLEPGGSRYLMLEAVRQFAAEELAASGDESTARDRHAAYFLAMAENAYPSLSMWEAPPSYLGSDGPAWVERLDACRENLLAALGWFEQRGDRLRVFRLATILCPFWDSRGYLAEGRLWMERALASVANGDIAPGSEAEARANLGLFVLRLGDFDRAAMLLDQAHRIWAASGDTTTRPTLHLFLGGVAEYQEDDERARYWYEQALDGFRSLGSAAGLAETLNNLADTAYRRGDYPQADRLAHEALTCARASSLPVQLGAALVTIGATAAARQEWDTAVASHGEALVLSRDAGHQLNLADSIVGLAEVAANTGDPVRAARLLGAVEAITEECGVPRLPHAALHHRAVAAARTMLGAEEYAAAVSTGRLLARDESIAESRAVTRGKRGSSSKPLTRREIDVLRLLVTGYSDRAIGDELFIGTRTVESHVARIFAKLGVQSRAAATATALSTGLVEPAEERPSAP